MFCFSLLFLCALCVLCGENLLILCFYFLWILHEIFFVRGYSHQPEGECACAERPPWRLEGLMKSKTTESSDKRRLEALPYDRI